LYRLLQYTACLYCLVQAQLWSSVTFIPPAVEQLKCQSCGKSFVAFFPRKLCFVGNCTFVAVVVAVTLPLMYLMTMLAAADAGEATYDRELAHDERISNL
jgi:hypothetical protein